MNCFAIAPDEVQATWPDYAHLFERFERDDGETSATEVFESARTGLMQIWGVQDGKEVLGVCATEVQKTARGRICLVRIAAGRVPGEIQAQLLAEIGTWARGLNCVAVRLIGRKGWLRRFKQFRVTSVVAEWNLRTN